MPKMSLYDTLWVVKDGSRFVSKDVANRIYHKLVAKEKFKYDGTHNGKDASDVLLFRLKQEFRKIGYKLIDNVDKSIIEVSISLNLFQYISCV